jgi:gliding motility-associated-like protein
MYPSPGITFNTSPTIKKGSSAILKPTVTGDIVSYQWAPATGLNSTSIASPTANPTTNTTYTLVVTSSSGCLATAQVTVFMDLSIINTFIPNGDGINDTWNIPNLEDYTTCKVHIYNRYGQQIYYSLGYGKPWDGSYGGTKLPSGTYYYVIDLNNKTQPLSGWVSIIR